MANRFRGARAIAPLAVEAATMAGTHHGFELIPPGAEAHVELASAGGPDFTFRARSPAIVISPVCDGSPRAPEAGHVGAAEELLGVQAVVRLAAQPEVLGRRLPADRGRLDVIEFELPAAPAAVAVRRHVRAPSLVSLPNGATDLRGDGLPRSRRAGLRLDRLPP